MNIRQKKYLFFSVIICLIILKNSNLNAQNRIDSLKQIVITIDNDTSKIKLFYKLGDIYKNIIPDSSILYYKHAYQLSKEISYKPFVAQCLNSIGVVYAKQSRYDKAIEIWQTASDIYKEISDKNGEASILGNIGVVYRNQGNYDKALKYYQKALKINESVDNKHNIAINLGNIGIVYKNQKNYNKALEYYNKALKMSVELNDKYSIARNFGNIGIIYRKKENYVKSLEFYKKALKIYSELGDKSGISLNLGNIGIVYTDLNKYKLALDYYKKSLKINREIGNRSGEAVNLVNIADLYNKLKDYNTAITYANKSLKIANKIGALRLKRFSYLYLSDSYYGLGNFLKALKYKNAWIEVNDSMYNSEKAKAIADMQTRYESEKKKQKIKLQQVEIERNKQVIAKETAEKEKQQSQRNMFIVAFVLSLILAFFVFRSYKQKKKANTLLAKQKEEILEKNEELNQQNEEITAQRDEIEAQKEIVDKVNYHISESIDYATRLQQSILPDEKILKKYVTDYFVLFKPKDKVSGDFYWWAHVEGQTVITAADSTGHGVPGAFMSMLGGSFLREIVQKEYITHTGVILRKLRKEIIKALKQTGADNEQKDGMDMAIVSINYETNVVQFSGANNPLYIVAEHIKSLKPFMCYGKLGLYEVKPDKMPISIYPKMDNYTTHEIQLEKGDQIYMFSDGYADQFGGAKGKKFKYKPFKRLLLENANKPMNEQKKILEKVFNDWKRNLEQIDDIVVLGIKI